MSARTPPASVDAVLALSPVIPVATIERVEDAVPLAEALHDGGVGVIEVTLRSSVALDAIEAIRRRGLPLCVGAGTLWTAQQALEAADRGAQFLVSPGIADAVGDAAARLHLPYLPGAQTATEMAHHVARGVTAVKFFPAGPAGGPAALAALAAVFPELAFCPTGGISEATAPEYLRLPGVRCVGGSWLATRALLDAGNWAAVRGLAARVARLRETLDA
jgi:2-dehydro-3-deoxyphosphogluconate aldolase / (4S)-4-hydroxy-2-oxoglutarate aldolase